MDSGTTYQGQKLMVRSQVTKFDHFTGSTGPYTQIQVGEVYVPGSACITSSYIKPIVVYYGGTLPTLEQGTAVVVTGVGNGVIPDPSQLPWIVADSVALDPLCTVTLTVHANPTLYIVLDRVRQRSAVTGAQSTGVCSGPHALSRTTLGGLSGVMSVNIPEGVTAWTVQYGTAP